MTQSGNIQRNTNKAGFTAWLAVAAVLILQVGAIAHEAQHSLTDVGDVCEICVKFEGSSAADTSSTHAIVTPVPSALLHVWTDAPVATRTYRTPQLRAPPATI